MNFLKLQSEAAARFRQAHPQYWLDMLVDKVKRERKDRENELVFGTVLAVLQDWQVGRELVIPGINIVTTKGDIYYAQMVSSESPTNDFDGANSGLRLGSTATTPTKADNDVTTFLATSGHALDATYERTVDPDTDNTGSGANIVTWRFSYLTSEGNVSSIQEGAIVDHRTTPTGALTHFLFAASFSKTSSDTLKVFVNHEFTGV
jgi:hypothetical protein